MVVMGCADNRSSDDTKAKDNEIIQSRSKTAALVSECQSYLQTGPPRQMTHYVPESLTETIIAHGVQLKSLDPELKEIGSMIIMESESFDEIKDPEIKAYMLKGVELVRRVIESQ